MIGCSRCGSLNLSLKSGTVKCNNCGYSWKPRRQGGQPINRVRVQKGNRTGKSMGSRIVEFRISNNILSLSLKIFSAILIVGSSEISQFLLGVLAGYEWMLFPIYLIAGLYCWWILDDLLLKPIVRSAEGGKRK